MFCYTFNESHRLKKSEKLVVKVRIQLEPNKLIPYKFQYIYVKTFIDSTFKPVLAPFQYSLKAL